MGRRLWYGLLVGLGAAAIALALWFGGALESWENATWMARVRRLAKPSAATQRIKLILVDQPSLDWGRKENQWAWPWPREVLAAVLDFCKRGGAKAVAFDVMYTEPSVYGVNDDQAFSAAIQQGAPFVAAVLAGKQQGDTIRWPGSISLGTPRLEGLEAWSRSSSGWSAAPTATFPIPEVARKAAQIGNVHGLPDADGMYRRGLVFQVFDGHVVPSLGLATYLAAQRRAGIPSTLSMEPGWLHVDGARIPIDAQGRTLLRFLGASGTHQAFSAAGIVQSELRLREGQAPPIDPEVFKDCYVFFGYSAPGLYDLQPTPVGDKYPGVEVHATMLDNLLERSFLRDAPTPPGRARHPAAGRGERRSRAPSASRVWQTVLGFLVFLALPFGLGFAAYGRGLWWPVMVGEAGAGFALVGAVVVNYATEGRQKAFLKNAFKHYLGAEVIEQIIADPARLTLGGREARADHLLLGHREVLQLLRAPGSADADRAAQRLPVGHERHHPGGGRLPGQVHRGRHRGLLERALGSARPRRPSLPGGGALCAQAGRAAERNSSSAPARWSRRGSA